MNKAEFISAIAEAAGSSKSDATAHVEAMINVVTNTLKSNDPVTLVGFGTFLVKPGEGRSSGGIQVSGVIRSGGFKNKKYVGAILASLQNNLGKFLRQ